MDMAAMPWLTSGMETLAVRGTGFLTLEPQHERLARAVDVRVEDADPRALRGPGEGEIHGHRRLAHAALAGSDGDNVFDRPERLQVALHRVRTDVGVQLEGLQRHIDAPLWLRCCVPRAVAELRW
jgi:hypothetical protein